MCVCVQMAEQQQQREKSLRQIDGDEGGLEMPPILISTCGSD